MRTTGRRTNSLSLASRMPASSRFGNVPKSERQHQQRALSGRTGAQGGRQRAINQSAGQPAPQDAEREGLQHGRRRQEAPRQRLDVAPQVLTGAFGEGQCPGHAEQIEAERHQHQVGQQVEGEAYRRLPVQRQAGRAERAGQGAGGDVGENAPGVVGEMHRPARGYAHRQRPDNAAAHADAMGTAEQADEKQGEIAGIRHRDRETQRGRSRRKDTSLPPLPELPRLRSPWNNGSAGDRRAGSGRRPWR